MRATADDLAAFSESTVDGDPGYLREVYGGSRSLFLWDATLQILMKKWMAFVTHRERDVSWTEAGRVMGGGADEFARWDEWYRPELRRAVVVTYPERIPRGGGAPPRAGIVLLGLSAAALTGVGLRRWARGEDLLTRRPWLRGAVTRRLYPEAVRVGALAVFLVMLASLALGSSASHRNLGSVYLWIVWWPLVPFLLFFTARSWCAVCPVATVADLLQRLPGMGRRTPGALARGGIWLVEGSFLAITLWDRSVGLVGSVRLTLLALLLLTAAAGITAAVYRGRTFCRHLCFFGALAGNYSMASVAELRPASAACRGCFEAGCQRRQQGSRPARPGDHQVAADRAGGARRPRKGFRIRALEASPRPTPGRQ